MCRTSGTNLDGAIPEKKRATRNSLLSEGSLKLSTILACSSPNKKNKTKQNKTKKRSLELGLCFGQN